MSKQNRRPYKSHIIITKKGNITVKNWMRENKNHFKGHFDLRGNLLPSKKDSPTSNQIGVVLVKRLGYRKTENETHVSYQII